MNMRANPPLCGIIKTKDICCDFLVVYLRMQCHSYSNILVAALKFYAASVFVSRIIVLRVNISSNTLIRKLY